MIFVHQMAKVGSMAWIEALRAEDHRIVKKPFHVHFLARENLQQLGAILALPGGLGGLSRRLVANHILREGRDGAAILRAARAAGQPIQVITGMRDPVARSLSLLLFFADFCGRNGSKLSAREGANADEVRAYLVQLWHDVIAARQPIGGFDRLVWYLTATYRNWFSEELQAVFEVDILASPFSPAHGAQRIHLPHINILAYRVEDMHPDAAAHQALLGVAADFARADIQALPAVNTAATRRSYPLYQAVRAQLRLPADLLDAIYDVAIVRHFYTGDEILAFKRRWGLA